MNRKGFTLVELMIACTVMAVMMGVVASMYAFTAYRAAHSIAKSNVISETQDLSNEIDKVVTSAVRCEIVTSGTQNALKCTMPKDSTDTNSDGMVDTFKPYAISRRGIEKYGEGKRVWFYFADSLGAFGSTGKIVYRAERTDDANPTGADTKAAFTYYPGTSKQRWHLIDSMSFTIDAPTKTVISTIQANSLARLDSRTDNAMTTDAAISRVATVTKTSYWRNYRK